MKLTDYLQGRGKQAELAAATGLAPAFVWQIAKGVKPVPVEHCAAIEQATSGTVTRQELRPDDWQSIWPELARKARKAA